MTKDLYNANSSNNKLYLCSKGIKRPVVLVQTAARNKLEEIEITTYKKIFQTNTLMNI